MSYSLGRLKQISSLAKSCKICVSSFKMNFSNRNVVKTLESRGMLEDVFPRETVHSLGEAEDVREEVSVDWSDCCSESTRGEQAHSSLRWI